MKGYGLPRNEDMVGPDMADIHQYGLATARGSVTGRALQRSKNKRAARFQ
jgi:hypothetical protein